MPNFFEELDDNFATDIFNDLKARLVDDNIEVEIYQNEFLDPDKVQELANRYASKGAFLVDIEEVVSTGMSSDNQSNECAVTIVLYTAYPEYREDGESVRSSIALANWGARRLAGKRLAAGTDHSQSSYKFSEIIKEDQIPYMSVHALRMTMNMTINFATPT